MYYEIDNNKTLINYSPARAIVSMILGIFASQYGLAAILISLSELNDGYNDDFAICFILALIIAWIPAVVLGVISFQQGKKYAELYQRTGSKMVLAGQITSIIGFVSVAIAFIMLLFTLNY